MANTRYFKLGTFDFGEPLGTASSQAKEIYRWTWLDQQIFGLMNIFGNGVISGWTVSATSDFILSVSPGQGIINHWSARSEFAIEIPDFPGNAIRYVYAKALKNTNYSEEVEFVLSPVNDLSDNNFVLLARVISTVDSISIIDNSVRNEIDFIDIINTAIKEHRHKGGANNPSKIKLDSEVQGELPSYNVSSIDADQISGTIGVSRLPKISHSDLEDIGILTHAELDSFVKSLELSNKELLGEISASNLLQFILALKLIHEDSSSDFYIPNKIVDEYMINELAVIPGITPDSRIDFEHSTANINLSDHYVEGASGTVGTSYYVRWETKNAWNSAYSMNNVTTSGDYVVLSYDENQDQSTVVVEDFNADPTGGFERDVLVFKDGEFINSSPTNSVEGFAAEFDPGATFRLLYVKTFSTPQDWSQYKTFTINVKTISNSHGPVKLLFVDEDGISDLSSLFSDTDGNHRSPDYTLLEDNEVTSNSNPSFNDFETRTIDLSSIPFNDTIKGVVIWTDDLSSNFKFFLDNMLLVRDVVLPEEGQLKLRYSTSKSVTFRQIEYSSEETNGSSISMRARASNSTALLTRSNYTSTVSSGEYLNLQGTDIEIEITFRPDSDRSISPILESLRILILSDAEVDGFSINSSDEFSRGVSSNIEIDDILSIENEISVGSYVYSSGDKVSQIKKEASDDSTYALGEKIILGNNSPIAPNQIFRSLEVQDSNISESYLYHPRCVKRMSNGQIVVADTYNDRILRFDSAGLLIEGFGSINYSHDTLTFPISSCLHTSSGVLYIVWSRPVSFASVNINRITVKYSGKSVSLLSGFDLINNKMPDDLSSSDQGQVMAVFLSAESKSLISQFPEHGARLQISDNAIPVGIGSTSEFYKTASNVNGIPLYIGNFFYTEVGSPSNAPVFCPTSVDYANEKYLYTNATIAVKPFIYSDSMFEGDAESVSINADIISIPTIIEADTGLDGSIVSFSAKSVSFSPFIPGRVKRIDDDTVLVGGIHPSGAIADIPDDEKFDFRNISGTPSERSRQKSVLDTMFFSGDSPYYGSVKTIKTLVDGGSELFRYSSPEGLLVSDADVDSDGNIVAAESSFTSKSGRIIRLDTNGNIEFSFGEGLYSVINSMQVKEDGSIIIAS